jgi:hypothetical protein
VADVRRDSTLSPRFALAATALRLEVAPPPPAFAFKCKDLRLTDGRFAAFFVALDFDFAFVAMAVPNCKCVAKKSQGVRKPKPKKIRFLSGTSLACFRLLLAFGHAGGGG